MGEMVEIHYPKEDWRFGIDEDDFDKPVYEDGKSHKAAGAKIVAYADNRRPYKATRGTSEPAAEKK